MISRPEIMGVSVRGYLHRLAKKPCQDAYKRRRLPCGVDIIAVADGHGGRMYKYSNEGSDLACRIFIKMVEDGIKTFGIDEFVDFMQDGGEFAFARKLEYRWKMEVYRMHAKAQRKDERIDIEIPRLYGTTLLGAVITDTEAILVQIGDGDVVIAADEYSAFKFHYSDELEGCLTHSMADREAWKHVHIKVIKRNPDSTLILATDGVSNAYASEEVFLDTCSKYVRERRIKGSYYMAHNLETWMNETSMYGSGDDITFVMIKGV